MIKKFVLFLPCILLLFTFSCGGGGSSGGSSGSSCSAGSFSCGPGSGPAGGPACCPVGTSCCFGYNLCCDENKAHLGKRRSDGAKLCYQSLNGEGVTWDLLTVCGKPAN
jgi:hypothetical protein